MKTEDFLNGKITYDREGQYLWIKREDGSLKMLGELRGWGAIQNLFKKEGGIIDEKAAAEFQDQIGEWVANALNEKLQFKPLPSISDVEVANIVGHDSYEYIDGRYVFGNAIIQAFYDGMIAMRDRLTTQKDNNGWVSEKKYVWRGKEITYDQAKKVIDEFPEEDDYVQAHYQQFLCNGEHSDNTIDTSNYWNLCKKIITPPTSTNR